MARVVYVLRHAEAASLPGGKDADRPLTDRGAEQAAVVSSTLARTLAGAGIDRVLCSPSVRTRQTLEPVRTAGLVRGAVQLVDAIYDAGSDTLVELLTQIDDDDEVQTVLLVGHAPGVPALCWELADVAHSDVSAMASLERGFPPGTVARIEVGAPWSDVGTGVGRLTDVVVTR